MHSRIKGLISPAYETLTGKAGLVMWHDPVPEVSAVAEYYWLRIL